MLASVKAPAPASGNDNRTWTAIEGTIAGTSSAGTDACGLTSGSLSLVLPDVCLEASRLTLDVNTFSGSSSTDGDAIALDWTKDVGTYNAATTTFTPVAQVIDGVTVDLSDSLLEASGVAQFSAFGLVSGSVGFSFTETTTDVKLADGTMLQGASLTEIGVTVANVFIGAGGVGFSLTSGELGIAIVKAPPPAPGKPADPRRWTAISSDLEGASLTGLPSSLGLILDADSLEVDVNEASGGMAPPAPLDWTADIGTYNATTKVFTPTAVKITVPDTTQPPPATVDITIGFTDPTLEVAGHVTISIGGFVYVSGSFALETGSDIHVTPSGSGSTVDVSLLELGIGNAEVFAGAGATVTPGHTLDLSNAVGVHLSGITIGLAMMKEIGATGTPRSYLALSASGAAALVGVTGLTLGGTVQVEVNSASSGNAIDFTMLPGGKLSVPTGPLTTDPTVDLAFSETLLEAAGTLTLEIDQGGQAFVYVAGSIAFQRSDLSSLTTENHQTGQASVVEVGASGVTMFFGAGATVDPTTHTINTSSAMGLLVSNASFGLALMTPSAQLAAASGAASFFALKATGSVALVGINGFAVSIQDLEVEVNQAHDSSGTAVSAAVDFTKLTGGKLSVPTGPDEGDPTVDLDFGGSIFEASGLVTLSIGSFVFLSGTVAFEKADLSSVGSLTLSDGTKVSGTPSALEIGASNVHVFVGLGGPYWVDSNGDGTIDSKDTPASAGATGLALSDAGFGLVLLKEGTASYYALRASADSIALVGVPGLTLSATDIEIEVNGSSSATGPVVDFTASFPGQPDPSSDPAGLAVKGTSLRIASSARVIAASGIVSLGIGDDAVAVTAGLSFEQTTGSDGPAIALAVSGLHVTLGSFSFGDTLTNGHFTGTNLTTGLFVISRAGVAGSVTLPGVHFSVGDADSANPTFGATFTADIAVSFNTGSQAINETLMLPGGGNATLNLPAGQFFSATVGSAAVPASLALYVSGVAYTLSGVFQLEQLTTAAGKEIVVAAADVSTGFQYTLPGGSSPSGIALSNGQGALIILPGGAGVAGALKGAFSANVDLGAFGGSAGVDQVSLSFNTSGSSIDQTVTVAGVPIRVDVAKQSWTLGLSHLTISFDDFLTLSGNFTVQSDSTAGTTIYGASDVEIFFGDGPYRLADGTVNPDAIGILLTGGEVGVVKYTSTGAYALYATGTAQLVGIDGLTIAGTVTVKVNQTGHAVVNTITMPDGSNPMSLTMPFRRAARIDRARRRRARRSAPAGSSRSPRTERPELQAGLVHPAAERPGRRLDQERRRHARPADRRERRARAGHRGERRRGLLVRRRARLPAPEPHGRRLLDHRARRQAADGDGHARGPAAGAADDRARLALRRPDLRHRPAELHEPAGGLCQGDRRPRHRPLRQRHQPELAPRRRARDRAQRRGRERRHLDRGPDTGSEQPEPLPLRVPGRLHGECPDGRPVQHRHRHVPRGARSPT